MRIAMISEHARPLAASGGEDAGGQDTHIADVATALAEHGHDVRVYPRRDSPARQSPVPFGDRVSVVRVPAGPAEPIGNDSLLLYLPAFGRVPLPDPQVVQELHLLSVHVIREHVDRTPPMAPDHVGVRA